MDLDRVKQWLDQGAQPTDARPLLEAPAVLPAKTRKQPNKAAPGKEAHGSAEEESRQSRSAAEPQPPGSSRNSRCRRCGNRGESNRVIGPQNASPQSPSRGGPGHGYRVCVGTIAALRRPRRGAAEKLLPSPLISPPRTAHDRGRQRAAST